MLNKSTPNKDVAVEFIENYMLSGQGPEDDQRRRAAGRAGQQVVFRRG